MSSSPSPASSEASSESPVTNIIDKFLVGMRDELDADLTSTWVDLGKVHGISPNRFSQWRNGRGIYLDRLDQMIKDWNSDPTRRRVSLVLTGGDCEIVWAPAPKKVRKPRKASKPA